MMERLDDTYRSLKAKTRDTSLAPADASAIKADLLAREKTLLPLYNQIALQFADLHDRPNRMKAKGTIRDSLVWTESRRYFYWRVRRRLQEESALKRLRAANPSLTRDAALQIVQAAISSHDLDLSSDRSVTEALEKSKAHITTRVKEERGSSISEAILSMSDEDAGAVIEGVKRAWGQRLSADDLATLSRLLSSS